MNIKSAEERISIGILLIRILLTQNPSRMLSLQIKKHLGRLEAAAYRLSAANDVENDVKVSKQYVCCSNYLYD